MTQGTIANNLSVTSHQLRIAASLAGGRFEGRYPNPLSRPLESLLHAGKTDFGIPMPDTAHTLLFIAEAGDSLMTGNALDDAAIRAVVFRYADLEPADDPEAAESAWLEAGAMLGSGGLMRRMSRRTLLDAVLYPPLMRCVRLHRMGDLSLPLVEESVSAVRWVGDAERDRRILDATRTDELVYFK